MHLIEVKPPRRVIGEGHRTFIAFGKRRSLHLPEPLVLDEGNESARVRLQVDFGRVLTECFAAVDAETSNPLMDLPDVTFQDVSSISRIRLVAVGTILSAIRRRSRCGGGSPRPRL